MELNEILENLCIYNPLNPNYFEDEFIQSNDKKECFCDNCFYGRDKLANELLKYIKNNK